MNVTTMIGRLTKDAEVRYTSGNLAVARFSFVCDRETKRNGEATADFYNCIAFGKTAELIEKYTSKGTQLGLEGRFQNNNWTDRDGKKHYDFQFNVNKITFLGKGPQEQEPKSKTADKPPFEPDNVDVDEDNPFF